MKTYLLHISDQKYHLEKYHVDFLSRLLVLLQIK